MKKNMLFLGSVLTMFFCANMAFAQATSASAGAPAPSAISSATTDPTLAGVADKTVSETFSLIRDSASVLGDTVKRVAPEAWRILILQQYVKAAKNIFTSLALCFMVCIYYRIINKLFEKPEDDYELETLWMVLCRIVPVVATLLVSLVFIFNMEASIQYVLNPEFGAIKEMIDMTKTIK